MKRAFFMPLRIYSLLLGMKKVYPLLFLITMLVGCTQEKNQQPLVLELPIPKSYEIPITQSSMSIDGIADENSWKNTPWTDLFIDIEGSKNPLPYFDTRVKMLWDDEFIYFYAELEEEHVWGDITERDAVIFHNNDFEIFIKPNQFQPYYAEFEVNALGTLWELFLARPYRRNGPVLNQWDVNNTQIGIDIQGTLNNPSDIDKGWSIEIAIPIIAIKDIDRGSKIEDGSIWRINFSRVQWQHQVNNGVYSRKEDANGSLLHENNWVWTEQSAIAMHRPEHWGYVFFSTENNPDEPSGYKDEFEVEQQLLYYLYRKQLEWNSEKKTFSSNITDFGGPDFLVNSESLTASITLTKLGFEITVSNKENRSITVNQDGYIITH